MKFENTKPDGGSYEKPNRGKYLGVLVGFAYVGIHSGGQYGPKPRVLLRWELHKRKGPSLDSQGFIHTITKMFGATVKGDGSLLKKCLEAHGIVIPEGGATESRDWLAHGAWLDVEWSDDEKWANVEGISRLDPEEDSLPSNTIHLEHWEPDDGTAPPSWAAWAVAKSTDLSHLAPKREARANGTTSPVVVGAAIDDDDDIPF